MAERKSQNALYSHFASFLKLPAASRYDLAKSSEKSGKVRQKCVFHFSSRKMPKMIESSDREA
jgi:hypothetical protein